MRRSPPRREPGKPLPAFDEGAGRKRRRDEIASRLKKLISGAAPGEPPAPRQGPAPIYERSRYKDEED